MLMLVEVCDLSEGGGLYNVGGKGRKEAQYLGAGMNSIWGLVEKGVLV